MPSIGLDTKHWTRFSPQGKTQVVKCLGFACYYSAEAEPPEISSTGTGGTELAANATLTVERPLWFRGKEPSTTEAPYQPSTLEVRVPSAETTGTGQIENEAVTEAKLAAKAVTPAKALAATTPTPSGTESLTAELGTAGVTRTVVAAYNAKHEASAKVKIKHGLNTEAVVVFAYTVSSKKPSERLADSASTAGAIAKIKIESAEEILVTLATGEPAAKEEFFYVVMG
jgi:hypothetical protein